MYVNRVNKDSAGSKDAFMMKKNVSLKRSKKQQLKLALRSTRDLRPDSRDLFTQLNWRSHWWLFIPTADIYSPFSPFSLTWDCHIFSTVLFSQFSITTILDWVTMACLSDCTWNCHKVSERTSSAIFGGMFHLDLRSTPYCYVLDLYQVLLCTSCIAAIVNSSVLSSVQPF